MSKEAWPATHIFGKPWGLQLTVLCRLLCTSILKDSCRSQKWHHQCYYQMEWKPYLKALGLSCLSLNGGGERISSRIHLQVGSSISICGYKPMTLKVSWVSELSAHSIDSSFILLVANESGSLFSPPPTVPTIHEGLSVPLPETLHLAKLILWAHNVNSGNKICIYLRYPLLRLDTKGAYHTLNTFNCCFFFFFWGFLLSVAVCS